MILKVAHNTASGKLFSQNEIKSLRWVKGKNRNKIRLWLAVCPLLKVNLLVTARKTAYQATPRHSGIDE